MTTKILVTTQKGTPAISRAGIRFTEHGATEVDLAITEPTRLADILAETKLVALVPETIDGDTPSADALRDAARKLHELAHIVARTYPTAASLPPTALIERGTASTASPVAIKLAELRDARPQFLAAHAAWKAAS